MSGFAAVFRFDGAPADPAALAAMTDAIAHRGPDGRDAWVSGPAAVSHLMLRTTAESLEETQPLASEEGGLVLAMDGWLANYDELRGELLARGAVLRTRADAELVLRAYEIWGDDCPKHIDGEYAFVVWDARRREAFCAKDHAGMRPLHYHWDGKRLLVASDLAGVLAPGDFEPRPNLGMIAEHLANEWYAEDETLWQGVLRLVPAHSMRVGASGPRLHRHWQPPLEVSIRYPRDEDYQAHYRELLLDSVRRASRSHRPIGCEVSGGLDSSAVFAAARRLHEQGGLPALDVTGYTHAFGDSADPAIDEIAFARAVGAHFGVEIREIRPFMPDIDWFAATGLADRDMAPYPNSVLGMAIGRAALAAGSTVVLNGEGGDEFLATYPFNYAEHLAELDWRSLRDSLREDRDAYGLAQALRHVIRFGAGPFVPGALRALRRRLRGASRAGSVGRGLLTPKLTALLEQRRQSSERAWPRIRNPARRSMVMIMSNGFTTYVHDFMSRNSARVGYEQRSPMYGRAFIEFALAIPDRQRRRGETSKYIHVAAMAQDLPVLVAGRKTKAVFNQPFTRTLDNAHSYVLTRMLQCDIDGFEGARLVEFLGPRDRRPGAFWPIYEAWAAFGLLNLFGTVKPGFFERRAE